MAGKVIVLVADRDDPRHGEVTVLESGRKAEQLVETLLEAGFEQERIRVFHGREMDIRVSHRPVVALVREEVEEPAVADDSPGGEESEAKGADTAEEEEEKESAAALVPEGVRFSSLFRSA